MRVNWPLVVLAYYLILASIVVFLWFSAMQMHLAGGFVVVFPLWVWLINELRQEAFI